LKSFITILTHCVDSLSSFAGLAVCLFICCLTAKQHYIGYDGYSINLEIMPHESALQAYNHRLNTISSSMVQSRHSSGQLKLLFYQRSTSGTCIKLTLSRYMCITYLLKPVNTPGISLFSIISVSFIVKFRFSRHFRFSIRPTSYFCIYYRFMKRVCIFDENAVL